jgi:hypothetical protein
MKRTLLVLTVAAHLTATTAMAQTTSTSVDPMQTSDYGQDWSLSLGSALFSNTEMTTLRTGTELETQWAILSETDREMLRRDCDLFMQANGGASGSTTGGATGSTTGTDTTATTGGAASGSTDATTSGTATGTDTSAGAGAATGAAGGTAAGSTTAGGAASTTGTGSAEGGLSDTNTGSAEGGISDTTSGTVGVADSSGNSAGISGGVTLTNAQMLEICEVVQRM